MSIREFKSGATRDTNKGKLEYFGFIHPICDYSFAKYMHKNRFMDDGSLRESNNWWKGFGKEATIQSLVRHIEDLKALYMGYYVYEERLKDGSVIKHIKTKKKNNKNWKQITEEHCCNAIRFNSEAYKLDILKNGSKKKRK